MKRGSLVAASRRKQVALGGAVLLSMLTLSVGVSGASVDNTTHSLGLAVWLLSAHPDQWSAVAQHAAPVGSPT